MIHLLKNILLNNDVIETLSLVRELQSIIKNNQYTIIKGDQFGSYTLPQNIQIETLKDIELYYQSHKIPQNIQILHQLAHIEFNALKSYIDTIYRFGDRRDFINDFAGVALEEADHFMMVQEALEREGYSYGSFPLHTIIRDRCMLSNESVLDRLAVVSLCQEGRGMDTGHALASKVRLMNPNQGDIISRIADDEERHVEVGLKWFMRLSNDPHKDFLEIMRRLKIPCNWKINRQRRSRIGFDAQWMQTLDEWKKY